MIFFLLTAEGAEGAQEERRGKVKRIDAGLLLSINNCRKSTQHL
jgi:hypothetical protein